MTAIETEIESMDNDTDTTIRTRIVTVEGAFDVREKWPTVCRYLNKAQGETALARFSISPTKRVAIMPNSVIAVEEITR